MKVKKGYKAANSPAPKVVVNGLTPAYILLDTSERVRRWTGSLGWRTKLTIQETLMRALTYLYLTGRSKVRPARPVGMPVAVWRESLWEDLRDPKRYRLPQMEEDPNE